MELHARWLALKYDRTSSTSSRGYCVSFTEPRTAEEYSASRVFIFISPHSPTYSTTCHFASRTLSSLLPCGDIAIRHNGMQQSQQYMVSTCDELQRKWDMRVMLFIRTTTRRGGRMVFVCLMFHIRFMHISRDIHSFTLRIIQGL